MDVERSNSLYLFQNLECPSALGPCQQSELLTAQLREAVETASAPDSCLEDCSNPPMSEYDYEYLSLSGQDSAENVAKKDLAEVIARILDHRDDDGGKVGVCGAAESLDGSEDMVMPAYPRKREYPEEGDECGDSGDSGAFMCESSKRLRQGDTASKSSSFEDRAFGKVEMASCKLQIIEFRSGHWLTVVVLYLIVCSGRCQRVDTEEPDRTQIREGEHRYHFCKGGAKSAEQSKVCAQVVSPQEGGRVCLRVCVCVLKKNQ